MQDSQKVSDGNGVTFRNVQPKEKEKSNEVTKKTEDHQKPPIYYGGNKGALFLIIFAPLFVIMINLMCVKDSCTITKLPTIPTDLSVYFNGHSCYLFGIYIIFAFSFMFLPKGPIMNGEPGPDGKTLKYKMNGIWISFLFWPIAILMAVSRMPLQHIHRNTIAFIILSTISAFAVSIYLYMRSFNAPKSELSFYGNTGNVFYDFLMGRERNPRIGNVDLKMVCIRFGLGTWAVYDLGLVWSQFFQYGVANASLLLSIFGNALYILDFFVFEETMLTSFTVNHQGTGFLLVFGSFVFVPYVYSLHSRLLLELNYSLSEPMLIGMFCIIGIAQILYRLANADKVMFIRYPDDPDVINYDYIEGDNGKFLLVDGWWANVRHPNYAADMLIALSWCLTSGFNDAISYIYFVFNVLFNFYQIRQNEDMCRREFGQAWEKYCQRAKYKLIRFIY